MADVPRPSRLRRCLRGLGLVAVLLLTLATRLVDGPVVFADFGTEGAVDFTDGDCYARMTRVKLVLEGKGPVIRHHDFENFPAGTEPHTTAPLDWLIAALALALRAVFPMDVARDLAGAWIGPLLGVGTALFLWRWSGRWNDGRGRPAAMIIFAASPILAHGQMIGRPDHQALLILLLAVTLAGELMLLRRFGAASASELGSGGVTLGLAWGLALWVSLWEPLILWLGVTTFGLAAGRSRWWTPERRTALVTMGAVLLVALAVEGARISPPGWFEGERETFQNWARSIGELRPGYEDSLQSFLSLSFSWGTGFLVVLPPLLLAQAWSRKAERRSSLLALGLLAATWSLTAAQTRWGYFLALAAALGTVVAWPEARDRWAGTIAIGAAALGWLVVFTLIFVPTPDLLVKLIPLPAILAVLVVALDVLLRRRPWARIAAGIVFAFGLWQTASELDSTLFQEGRWRRNQEDRIARNRGLRAAARAITVAAERSGLDGAIASSWWNAPALAYRTGRPALTGSSHQSLDGNAAYTYALIGRPALAGARHLRALGVRWLAWSEIPISYGTHRYAPQTIAGGNWALLHDAWHPGFIVRYDDSLNEALSNPGAAARGLEPTVFLLRDDADPPWQAVE